jgi:hypothetical protein
MNLILDPLIDLPEPIHSDLQDILRRCAAAGLRYERHPTARATTAVLVEGAIFQITVLFDAATGEPSRIAIMGPGARTAFGELDEWDRQTFLDLLPDARGEPAPEPEPNRLSAFTLPEDDTRSLLRDIRDELRAIRTRLGQ